VAEGWVRGRERRGVVIVPEYGRIDQQRMPFIDPPDVSGFPPPPWKLPGAEVLQVTIEVDTEAALDYLPEQLTRPVPAYAKLIIARYLGPGAVGLGYCPWPQGLG
jgi:hypothetical protein